MEKKTAVYICTGCGIGEALDIDALSLVATDEFSVPICRRNPFYCSQEGVDEIKKDIDSEGVNTVVIAACSPRVNYDTFDLGNVILDRPNIREQVAWCHPANDENTQMLAEDTLRLGLIKVDKSEPPVPYLKNAQGEELVFSKDILVVGGGAAGMSAALEASKAGYRVSLVEKEAALGGFGAKLKMSTPTKPPYQELEETAIAGMIEQIEASDKIKVFTSAEIEKIEGGPGLFDATIKAAGGSETARYGAIVQATGWKPYDPEKLTHLGYGLSPDIITNVQMEEMAAAGAIARPSDGAEPMAVAFIQCAGSRDPNHLPYCSAVCCRASLKQSIYLKEQNPEMAIYIIHKDVRTPGQDEEFYRQAQRAGVVFIRGEIDQVTAGSGKIQVQTEDQMLNEKISLEELDIVVLATGLVPNAAVWLEDAKLAPEDGEKKEEQAAQPKVANPILNLAYRQGPDLPNLKYGFPDSHFICFPYETRRTGIYAAGCVRRPMTMTSSIEDATGAAMKAIQAVESVAVGQAVHPRAGDLSYPEFFMQRCTQCKRCTEECPFGAINEDEKANPLPSPTRCRRCGVCMGACPERIISFKNYSVDQIGSMIKGINVPDEYEEKPRVVALVCENDAYPALDMVGLRRLQYSPFIRIIPLRCLGSINLVWIADALAKGIDGIILLGCRPGDDYQCHFIKGSELAQTRMSKIQETLDRLVLESSRVRVEEISITDWDKIPAILDEFMENIATIGPNPYKGF